MKEVQWWYDHQGYENHCTVERVHHVFEEHVALVINTSTYTHLQTQVLVHDHHDHSQHDEEHGARLQLVVHDVVRVGGVVRVKESPHVLMIKDIVLFTARPMKKSA